MAKKTKEEWKVSKNVFSLSSERNLHKFQSQGFFEHMESPIKTGKESNIFSAVKKDGTKIIIKMYRMENCNFNKMYEYIRPDPRYMGVKKGKRNIIFSWVQREYRNMIKAREIIRVPTPLVYRDNILLMEYIGDDTKDGGPAPMLKYSLPTNEKEISKLYNQVMKNVFALYKAGLVHGDLSEFNILNHQGKPILIDFSQCTTANNPNASELLERDIFNVCNFFGKYVDVDLEKELEKKKKMEKPA
ncbi:MAG: serine protein kinase RIO [Nanoarchaeota archaeon]|nr:serine protein kinase RIO [Nanoarchaeota archaeon]